MRILIINSFFSFGGPPRVIKGLYDILINNGNECLLASAREKPIAGMHIFKIGNKFSVFRNAIMARIFDNEGFSAKRATKRLIRKIEEYKPDIINLHNLHGYYINIPILFDYLKQIDTPIVWTLHDCWAFTGHCGYFDLVGCEKWRTGCHHCPQKKSYPKSILLDQSKRNWIQKKELFTSIKDLTIVTPSQWLADLVKESFLNKYPVKVINNGIDLTVFKPTESNWKEEHNITKPIVLACAAIWDARKGFKDVLEVANQLPECQVVIVGISAKQAKNLPKNIIGIQRTESVEDLVKIYSAADVFINPTYEDNFPTVNLEALACGTPVITYDTGGSPECIDETCGFIVPKGDAEAMKKKISDAILNEEHLSMSNCLGQASLFSKSEKFKQYYLLFLNICETN